MNSPLPCKRWALEMKNLKIREKGHFWQQYFTFPMHCYIIRRCAASILVSVRPPVSVLCALSVTINVEPKTTGKKFVTLSGGCKPEASTLPPVIVLQFFLFLSGNIQTYLFLKGFMYAKSSNCFIWRLTYKSILYSGI